MQSDGIINVHNLQEYFEADADPSVATRRGISADTQANIAAWMAAND